MSVATAQAPDPKHNVKARARPITRRSTNTTWRLWEVLKGLVTKEPKSQCVPALWKFTDAKQLVLEAGEVITADEAERRVLVLENPALRGKSRITNSLFAGIQLILPGEIAPAHRHAASAIRFVLDGEGAYTAVEGEKSMMAPGDFILTPNWAPHDHGNTSNQPMLWLDVLDVPTVNFFETSFSQHFYYAMQNTSRHDGDSLVFYGSRLLPDRAPTLLTRTR